MRYLTNPFLRFIIPVQPHRTMDRQHAASRNDISTSARYHTLMAAATLEPTFILGNKKANPDLRSPSPPVTPWPSRTQHSTIKEHPPHEPDPQPRAAHVPGHRQVRSTRSAQNLRISDNYRAPGRRSSGFWAPFRSDDSPRWWYLMRCCKGGWRYGTGLGLSCLSLPCFGAYRARLP